MSNYVQVEQAFQTQIANALVNSGAPTYSDSVLRGWPQYADLTTALATGQYVISIFTSEAGSNTTKYMTDWGYLNAPVQTLFSTCTSGSITFSGSATNNIQNIHSFIGIGTALQDIYYQTINSDTPNSVASKVATAINTVAPSGVHAVATGATVAISGTLVRACNIGTIATLVKDVRRTTKQVRVTCWCPSPAIRDLIGPIVDASIGTEVSHWLPLSDGSQAFCKYINAFPTDEKQKDFSLFRYDIIMSVEFSTYASSPAAQIESFQTTEIISANLSSSGVSVSETLD